MHGGNNRAKNGSMRHLRIQEQKLNSDYIKRRTVCDHSDKMKTIEGQYQ